MSVLDLFPGKWAIYAGIMAATFAAGASSAWWLQELRMDSKEKQHVEQVLADERSAAKTAIRRAESVIEAGNKATARLVAARAAAAAADAELDGLRSDTANYLQGARASLDACTERADTLGGLFDSSAGAYKDLAGKAARHAVDVQKLQDAWPK